MERNIPTNPDHLHDYLLDIGGEVFGRLEENYPGFKEATTLDDGSKVFFELSDCDRVNQYWITLSMPSKHQCIPLMNYIPFLAHALKNLQITALQGVVVLYKSDEEYHEEIFCQYYFKENNQ